MKKLLSLGLLICFGVCQPLFAQPAQCPSVDEIKTVGLSQVMKDKVDGSYFTGEYGNNYGTEDSWIFSIIVSPGDATSKADALNKATAALQTLSGNPKPLLVPFEDANDKDAEWFCLYSTDKYMAVAFTPVPFFNDIVKTISANVR